MATYRIPLANVPSPDNLEPLAGNVYRVGADAGDMQIGFAGTSGFGTMVVERARAVDGRSRLRADRP